MLDGVISDEEGIMVYKIRLLETSTFCVVHKVTSLRVSAPTYKEYHFISKLEYLHLS